MHFRVQFLKYIKKWVQDFLINYIINCEIQKINKMKFYGIIFLNTTFVFFAYPVEFVFYSTGVFFACHGGAQRSRMVKKNYI